ncbi:MAG: hypothetical protein JRG82_18285, partial [Deltaproteobacteria bacterium]|nr:hypothetical protein [Deltaproteobacteria bacterium]
YVEEVVRSWVEEGAVEVTDRGFLATDRVQHAVLPATVGEVILARIDALPQDEKEVLRVAAVIGGSFQEAVLVQYFDDKERLARDLASLEAGQYIVRRERPQGARQGVEYAFKNPLAQELVYDGMLHATREELHRSVGEAIENALTENVPGYHAMLAYHFSLANDVARAEESLFRAGDEAARSSASNEALHFFQEASKLYVQVHADGGDARKRAHLEKNIANALYNRGMVKESLEHFHAALECMGERVLRHPLALQARFAGDLLAILARLYAGRLLRRPREADAPTQEIIRLMHRRSEVESTAEPTRFLFDSVATIRRVLQFDPAGLAQADGLLAGGVGIFSFGGVSFSIGQRFLDVARRAAEANAGHEPDVLFRFMAYLHYFLSGDWSPEHEIPDEVLDESLRKGRLMEVTMYSEVVADKLLRQGRFESVGPWQERIERVWDTFEYLPARVGRYLLQMQVAHARRSADTPALAEAFAEEVGGEGLHLFALGHEADVRTARGELEEAAAAIAKGEEILARPGRRLPYHLSAFTTARFRYDVARLEAAAGGERAKREAAARKSASHATRAAKGAVFREAELARLQGRLAWLRGRHDEALREWGRSLDAAESLDLAPDAARTAAELAVRLRDPGAPKHEFRGRPPEDWAECAMSAFAGLSLDYDRAALEAKFR